jgi:hypothetical protein
MYTYNKTFVGIPLSQFHNKTKPTLKSKLIIEMLANVAEDDLNFDYISKYIENQTDTKLIEILSNIRDFWNESKFQEYNDFKKNNGLGFWKDYNGADDSPMIFGLYIDEFVKMPKVGMDRFEIDIREINYIENKMKSFVKDVFGEEIYNILMEDGLIGVFVNNHSS